MSLTSHGLNEMGTPPPGTTMDLESARDQNAGSHGGAVADVDYSVFTVHQKRYIVFMASWAGFFSPVSSQIYFPALNTLARDLHVSNSLINLTLTSYMVCWSSVLDFPMLWIFQC